MLYTRKTFSAPASSGKSTSQRRWDFAMLSRNEFIEKYGEDTLESLGSVKTPEGR